MAKPTQSDLDAAIDKLTGADWTEESKVTVVVDARPPMPTKPDSDPPTSGGLSIGKKGIKTGKLPPVATVLIVAIVVTGLVTAFVLTR